MSTTLVKVQNKGAVTIPTHLRSQAGIAEGDMMEVSFHRGKIILVPKVVVDRSKFPNADDEYTLAQRRVVDARLAKAEKDIKRKEGIIQSMTPLERRKPDLIKATRKRRIAAGAGVHVQEVNRLLNEFEQMQGMMKKMKGGGLMKMMKRMGGGKGMPKMPF